MRIRLIDLSRYALVSNHDQYHRQPWGLIGEHLYHWMPPERY